MDTIHKFRCRFDLHCNVLLKETREQLNSAESYGIINNDLRCYLRRLMHFTVRYKLDERAEKPKLHLSLPDRLTILPDSVTCTDTEITFEEDAQTILLFYVSNTLSGENITWDELLGKKPQAKS